MRRGSAERPLVVLVEDDPDFQTILRGWLRARYETVSFLDGEDLLQELPALRPDLVVMDVRLPGPSGYQLCDRMRSDSRLASIPVLFLTSLRTNEDFLKNLEVGGSAFLSKPVERKEFLWKVDSLLGSA